MSWGSVLWPCFRSLIIFTPGGLGGGVISFEWWLPEPMLDPLSLLFFFAPSGHIAILFLVWALYPEPRTRPYEIPYYYLCLQVVWVARWLTLPGIPAERTRSWSREPAEGHTLFILILSVVDPDPYWIRIQELTGSVFGIRIRICKCK